MKFLKQNLTQIILFFFGGVFCFGILKQVFDPNFSKYKYFEQHCDGQVISNSYDQLTHSNIIKSSDRKKIYLEDLDIIILIKSGDSITKKKDVTYFTIYKKDHRKIVYDMYDKKLRILK